MFSNNFMVEFNCSIEYLKMIDVIKEIWINKLKKSSKD